MKRRDFLRVAGVAGVGAFVPSERTFGQAPAIVASPSGRPQITHGVASGDVTSGRALVWSRTDRPARMFVEYSTTESFANARRVPGPAALEPTDYTARVIIPGLPDGQRIFYRVLFQDLSDLKTWSEPAAGSFKTPPVSGNVRIAWSADTVGQGWGINPEWGGLRLYETMLRAEPDVFINSGDTIYADQPLVAEVKLDDGTIWKNVVTEAKSHVAQTLDDFRGCYQYNLTDEHMRRFNAAVPQIVQWDDHEVHDNWYPTRSLEREPRFTVKSMALLAARARQAFGEYNPITLQGDDPERVYRTIRYGRDVEIFVLDLRSYRSPNNANMQMALGDDAALMGGAQLAWLKDALVRSQATWKVIASDLPIGIDVPERPGDHESFSNRDPGAPRGRELELADLLRHMKRNGVRNVVWITADVHYCAAHHYDPSRAAFTEFDPFWEFVAGPLNAGTFGADPMDATFGPEVKFIGVPADMKPNRPPSAGLQFFGTLTFDAKQRSLTAALHDLSGKALYSVELAPAGS